MWSYLHSQFLRLAKSDLIKGAFLSAIVLILTAILAILETGNIPTWDSLLAILSSGAITFIGYLIKNLLSNSADQPLKTEANVLKNEVKFNSEGNTTTTITVKGDKEPK